MTTEFPVTLFEVLPCRSILAGINEWVFLSGIRIGDGFR